MNTRTKTAIGIVAIAIVVALGVYASKNIAPRNVNTRTDTTSSATSPSSGNKKTFGDILKQGGSYACTIEGPINATTSAKGTVYASGGKVRGDVTLSTKTQRVVASFVAKDGYIYYWNSAMPTGQGLKLKYDLSSYKLGDFDQFDQIGNYDCQQWTPDNSMFALPTTTTFQGVK